MTDLISSGVELMLAGMGIVYMFLVMLVSPFISCLQWYSVIFQTGQRYSGQLPEGMDKATVAAITAAVHQYRNKHR